MCETFKDPMSNDVLENLIVALNIRWLEISLLTWTCKRIEELALGDENFQFTSTLNFLFLFWTPEDLDVLYEFCVTCVFFLLIFPCRYFPASRRASLLTANLHTSQ